MDGKAWIYLGSIMIAIGSTVMEFDGTTNVFRMVKETGDLVRRQI